MPWYKYNGGDIGNPNNYTNVGNTPPSCPNPNIRLCAIQAADNMGQPIITAALIMEISNALNNRVETTNVLLCP
ncbi:hypothetical protein [Sphingobacterium sp. MYb388]|jgi:hypothetical protein|uniref:hypothetical protein n=1 Tax=Sphingobacterium sp. MYb388 TaxID=2745437 RepID=UPI00309F333F